MKVMIIGGGGREMALVEHVAQYHEVYAAETSDAIADIATPVSLSSNAVPERWEELADKAIELGIDLTIVGPEAPLASGVSDVFRARGLAIFGPTQAAAHIEASKAFAKEIMVAAHVPTASYELFTSNDAAEEYLSKPSTPYPIVLKENGLRAGKGVTIESDLASATETLSALTLTPENPLIIEEYLDGFEFSLIVAAHGTQFVALPVAQDHKPIGEGNTGPNTGGMGAISPVPRVSDALYNEAIEMIVKPTLAQMVANSTPFTGFLYAGLISTARGIKVIEFNARLGDPECEVILPRLEADLASIAAALLNNGDVPLRFPVTERTCLGIVLSSPGYPGKVTASPTIPETLLNAVAAHPDAGITHMGTKRISLDGGWQAAGGRVAIVTMFGADIADCRAKLLPLLEESLTGSELYYRRDIGTFAG